MDVVLRRRIATRPSPQGPRVTHVDDETFDGIHEAVDPSLSAMEAPRSGRMADILAIASDQEQLFAAILTGHHRAGGPGLARPSSHFTGRMVAHTYRERLARDGVLIVGPSNVFLPYIDQVLPSLGETDVVLLTPRQLYPDVRPTADDSHDVARIKGSDRMARVIARAVAARVRIPRTGMTLTTHWACGYDCPSRGSRAGEQGYLAVDVSTTVAIHSCGACSSKQHAMSRATPVTIPKTRSTATIWLRQWSRTRQSAGNST